MSVLLRAAAQATLRGVAALSGQQQHPRPETMLQLQADAVLRPGQSHLSHRLLSWLAMASMPIHQHGHM